MNNNLSNPEIHTVDLIKQNQNLWNQIYQSQNILIPIELDSKDKVISLFVFDKHNFPVGGQKNLIEITGTPFTPELANVKVYFCPILPAIQKNYEKALIMLADSIDRCDSSVHSDETSMWAERLAEHIGLNKEEVKRIKKAAKLHDIGKAVVPRDLLIKPGPLSSDEWEIIRRHPGYGATLMEPVWSLNEIRPLVRSHHEHFSGGGYPDGLKGEEIPLGARIISVADAFSTMVTRRIYRTPVSEVVAIKELKRCSGTQFDPTVVDHMLDILARIN
jgi:HD-GYP domain-containing protein (c-di-GMP phosphodiesterase class II)